MPLMVPVSLIKNSKYLFIHKNVLMAGIYGAPLQGNFSSLFAWFDLGLLIVVSILLQYLSISQFIIYYENHTQGTSNRPIEQLTN